jgi:hypothetical protein
MSEIMEEIQRAQDFSRVVARLLDSNEILPNPVEHVSAEMRIRRNPNYDVLFSVFTPPCIQAIIFEKRKLERECAMYEDVPLSEEEQKHKRSLDVRIEILKNLYEYWVTFLIDEHPNVEFALGEKRFFYDFGEQWMLLFVEILNPEIKVD